MYIRTVKVKGRTYLQLVESVREGQRVRQVHIAHLGSVQKDAPQLERIATAILDHCSKRATSFESLSLIKASEYGRVFVCEKLFRESGLERFLNEKVKKTKRQGASLPHIKAMIYNRLCDPRSKYSLLRWLEDVHLDGIEVPEKVSAKEQKRFAETCYQSMDFLLPYKEGIEKLLFNKVRTLFEELEVVMYDLTSVYFEGKRPFGLAEYGHSTDKKKGHKQIVVGVVMAHGFPIAYEVFRGNIRHSETLQQIVEDLGNRYGIKRVVLVADTGLLTKDNVDYLEKNQYEYILCAKRRRAEEWDKMFGDWEKEAVQIKKGLRGCEKYVDGKRVILCHSQERYLYEAQMRESIMRAVEKELKKLSQRVQEGRLKEDKKIITCAERIFSRKRARWYFTYTVSHGKFDWHRNEERLSQEKFIEGKFFIWTNNEDMKASLIIQAYKDLWRIERGFRTLKDFIGVRPIYHWTKRRVRAHVFVCMLAFFLERLLQRKIDDAEKKWTARRLLDSLRTIKVGQIKIGDQVVEKVSEPGPLQQSMLKNVFPEEQLPL